MLKTITEATVLALLFAILLVLYAISPELNEVLRGLK